MRLREVLSWVRAGLFLLVGGLGGLSAAAQGSASPEAAIKAGFVYNFGKFTEWPSQALPAGQLVLCVVGPDAQGAIATAIEGRVLQGRVLSVRRQGRGDDVKACQIVYVTDADERRLTDVLRQVRNQPVLTVGDVDGFVDAGGMIGLGVNAGRVSFEINHEAALASGLKLSSQLLKLATAVRGRAP